ncbi:hypothetical protein [Ectopseudomonas toyotomiensis]|uniref:hypothetical protein n=1 Tax=Ectopseudomonas toyotomiensis TaxID=554344 RepID=UPI003D13CF89
MGKGIGMLDREFHVRFTLGDLAKWLFFSPIVVGVAYLLYCLPWGNADAPAWVQAVGSVVAIGVAVWVANAHTAFQVKQVKDREAQVLRLALSLSRHAAELIEMGVDRTEAGKSGVAGLRTLHQVMNEWDRILGGIDYYSLPNPEAAAAWIEVHQALRGANRSVVSVLGSAAFAQQELVVMRKMHQFAVAAIHRLAVSAAGHLPDLKVSLEVA